MSTPATPRTIQFVSHRWCGAVRHCALAAVLPPLLFGAVDALALAALVGLVLVAATAFAFALSPVRRARTQRPCRAHTPPGRAVVTIATDALTVLIAAGLLIGSLCTTGAAALPTMDTFGVAVGFVALAAVHRAAHRRSRH